MLFSTTEGWQVFALVIASTIADSIRPILYMYPDDSGLRKHLYQCIVTKKLTPFYSGQAKYNPGKPIKSILRYTALAVCKMRWYFAITAKTGSIFTCVGVAPGTKLKAVYCCSACLIN